MIETNLDLWQLDAIKVITTNAIFKNNKAAVMGAGIAREARDKYPGIDKRLGIMIQNFGNNPHLIWSNPVIFSFPTKWHWKEKADIKLIENSAKQLVQIADAFQFKYMALPRPGCGNGGLEWKDVKLVLEPILDDRFIICHK